MKEQDLKLKIAELKDTIVFLRKELELIKNKNKMENKETLEEAAEKQFGKLAIINDRAAVIAFKAGAKWQQERMYSEKEVHNIIISYNKNEEQVFLKLFYNEWFEQFKKK